MKAIITGASSGLGKEFAKQLSKKGYDLVLVARRKERLRELKDELDTNIDIVTLDLSFPTNCVKLFKKYKKENIDILINNAGFGVFGNFDQTPLDRELELIDINMMATDEVYTMIEPLLASQPMSMERGMSKLVDMYVAMVQRGLKTTIDQVPIRYRAEVQAILEALEK